MSGISLVQIEKGPTGPRYIYENKKDDFAKEISEEQPPLSLMEATLNDIFMSGDMPILKRVLFSKISNPLYFALFLCDIVLRGVAQVFLCDHPVTGVLVCIGLFLTSPILMLYGLWGSFCGAAGAYLIGKAPVDDIRSGLCGYDGSLVACAVWAFLDAPQRVLCATAAILAFCSGYFHVSLGNMLKRFSLPAFTVAFNVVMISFLLGNIGDVEYLFNVNIFSRYSKSLQC